MKYYINLIIILIVFLLISNLEAGEIKYYSPDGSVISNNEYSKISEEKAKEINDKKQEKIDYLRSKKDEFGRHLYDLKGYKIHYVEQTQTSTTENQKQKKQVNNDMPYDYLGRPLKTAEGNWITYPGEENNSRMPSYSKRSYSRRSFRSDMSSARWADTYKDDYLKSGKMTDLIKYKDASRKAMGLGDGGSDMSSAHEADRYQKKYLRSGKMTDLIKYKEASRKAMGLDD